MNEIRLEDGRRANKVTQEITDPTTGESKIVTEVFAEPALERKLTQRVVETKRPVVVRREIESINEAGEVVDRRIESTEPEVRMELREHITTNSLSALSVDDCNCYVTQEDMKACFADGLLSVMQALKSEPKIQQPSLIDRIKSVDLSGSRSYWIIAALGGVLAYLVFLY